MSIRPTIARGSEGALAILPSEGRDGTPTVSLPVPPQELASRKGRTLLLAEFDNLRQPWIDTAMKGVAGNLVAHA